MKKILFICHGNICRSPMAEFVMKHLVEEAGLSDQFEIASAATEGFNEMVHESLDYRAADMLRQMKVPFTEHYSRQMRPNDYRHFDYILAMDDNNVRGILEIIGEDKAHKIHRLMDFTENPRSVKDPWYTGRYEKVCEQITDCIKDIFANI